MGAGRSKEGDATPHGALGRSGTTQFGDVLGRTGKQVSGRYHLLPQRLEDDYLVKDKGPSPQVLGSGFNGHVYLATKRSNPMSRFAVKSFNIASLPKSKKGTLESEIEIFLLMDHPHVARLLDVYESETHLQLVMECMEGGELFDRVTKIKRFGETDCADAVWQMLLSLNYIHSHGIVHRDLKLENFLYEKKDGRHLKLIDFGFSKIWDPNIAMQLSCGTLSYVAPEVLRKKYTSQCDLWSLGVLTFIMLSGYMPFHGSEKDQTANILAGKFVMKPEKWDPLSAEGKDFTRSLLQVDPTVRLTAEQALNHPWIINREKLGSVDIDKIDNGIVDALRAYRTASKFRRSCMEMMAWSLSTEERAKVREYFIAMDTGGKGTITLAQLREVLVDRFEIAEEETKDIFEAMQSGNSSEEIHYSDFLAAMLSTRIALHDDLLRSAFQKFDVDNSGYITAENLKQILGEAMEGQDISELMAEADRMQDGKISYEEFVAYLKDKPLQSHMEAATSIIDKQIKDKGRKTPMRLRRGMTARIKASYGSSGGGSNPEDDQPDGDRRRKRDVVMDNCVVQ